MPIDRLPPGALHDSRAVSAKPLVRQEIAGINPIRQPVMMPATPTAVETPDRRWKTKAVAPDSSIMITLRAMRIIWFTLIGFA